MAQVVCVMLRRLALLAILLWPAATRADDERRLTTLEQVHAACRDAEMHPARDLLLVEVEPGWSFGELDDEGFLAIRPRRAFRAIGGRVELVPAHMETLGLVATEERAQQLTAQAAAGARLRIGFFLGYDEPDRTACVIRSRHAVTTVRMDVGFVELVAADGAVIAREDGDRLRAWQDDHERTSVPGQGPRAAIGPATTPSGSLPDPWQQGIAGAAQGEVGRAIADCHRAGIARGAEPAAQVVVRLRVEGRTGRVTQSALAISDLGDSDEGACVADALRNVTLPPGPPEWAGRSVDVDVPVRLAAD